MISSPASSRRAIVFPRTRRSPSTGLGDRLPPEEVIVFTGIRTRTEERLYGEVLTELNEEYYREEQKRQERARTMKRNLLNHHFFWERLKALWPNLRPDERLHTLQLLQDKEWNERVLVEVRQIIENAQFFAALGGKTGVAEGPYMLTLEELDLLLDVPDESLWDEMVALYPKRPASATEDGAEDIDTDGTEQETAHDAP
jgi:hypothetical protein